MWCEQRIQHLPGVMAVQQIPRYILLLEDLKKLTCDQHVDMPYIGKALASMKDIAERINAKKGFSLAIDLVPPCHSQLTKSRRLKTVLLSRSLKYKQSCSACMRPSSPPIGGISTRDGGSLLRTLCTLFNPGWLAISLSEKRRYGFLICTLRHALSADGMHFIYRWASSTSLCSTIALSWPGRPRTKMFGLRTPFITLSP